MPCENTLKFPQIRVHLKILPKTARNITPLKVPLSGQELAQTRSRLCVYDPLSMPHALVKAHRELDKAVDRRYFSKPFANKQDRLEFLFQLYEKLTTKENTRFR